MCANYFFNSLINEGISKKIKLAQKKNLLYKYLYFLLDNNSFALLSTRIIGIVISFPQYML